MCDDCLKRDKERFKNYWEYYGWAVTDDILNNLKAMGEEVWLRASEDRSQHIDLLINKYNEALDEIVKSHNGATALTGDIPISCHCTFCEEWKRMHDYKEENYDS